METQTGIFRLNSQDPSATRGRDTSTFASIRFPRPFPEGSEVIVIPQVQTFNEAETPGIRIADVTTTGFKIRMNEVVGDQRYGRGSQEVSDGTHYTETIGYVAYTV